jgi:hypothetical protein
MRFRIRKVWTTMLVGQLPGLTKEVVDGITANAAIFTDPDPPLADLTDAANKLQKAQDGLKSHPGTTKDRDEKRSALEALLGHEADYVLSEIEKLPPDKAAAAIEASGFTAYWTGRRGKADMSVTAGSVSGSVEVDVRREVVAEKKSWVVIFYWQYSLNGKDWIDCEHTLDTRMTIRGLPVGTVVSFRYRAYVQKAFTDYSQIMTLLVV